MIRKREQKSDDGDVVEVGVGRMRKKDPCEDILKTGLGLGQEVHSG